MGDTTGHLSLAVYRWKIKFLIQRWFCWGIRMEVRQWLGLGLEGRGWGWGQGWEEQMVGNITTSLGFWKAHPPGLGKVPSHNHVIY